MELKTGDSSGITPYGYSWDTVQKYKQVPAYDWQHKMIGRIAFQQTHNISISGGSEATQYLLSLTDNDQDGQLLDCGIPSEDAVSFRFDHKVSDLLEGRGECPVQ